MAIWFTSDTHFGHASIIKFCNRPFLSPHEMDDAIIEKWNSVIAIDDEVWHLGDFSFYRDEKVIETIINKLNGNLHLLIGNHDNEQLFKNISKRNRKLTIHTGIIKRSFPVNGDHATVIMSHYPMREWDQFYRGSYHLFGHVHGKMSAYCRSMDVGLDNNHDMLPFSIEKIFEVLSPNENKH